MHGAARGCGVLAAGARRADRQQLSPPRLGLCHLGLSRGDRIKTNITSHISTHICKYLHISTNSEHLNSEIDNKNIRNAEKEDTKIIEIYKENITSIHTISNLTDQHLVLYICNFS